jgi:hypothetical protein
MLTQERLKQRLSYDPETGVFTRRAGRMERPVGHAHKSTGYLYIRIDGRSYEAHRLAWLYVHGVLPLRLDHRNLVRMDNRIANLRLATRSQNHANRLAQANSQSGLKGVCWDESNGRWKAQLQGRHLGSFATAEEGAAAYDEVAKQVFGNFARTNFVNAEESAYTPR